jgi:glycine dehydrogenase
MGPIGAKKHLEPFLPGHSVVPVAGRSKGAVTASPWGSASILSISYAFVKQLGQEGLLASSQHAILNANYLATKIEGTFKVLYKGT